MAWPPPVMNLLVERDIVGLNKPGPHAKMTVRTCNLTDADLRLKVDPYLPRGHMLLLRDQRVRLFPTRQRDTTPSAVAKHPATSYSDSTHQMGRSSSSSSSAIQVPPGVMPEPAYVPERAKPRKDNSKVERIGLWWWHNAFRLSATQKQSAADSNHGAGETLQDLLRPFYAKELIMQADIQSAILPAFNLDPEEFDIVQATVCERKGDFTIMHKRTGKVVALIEIQKGQGASGDPKYQNIAYYEDFLVAQFQETRKVPSDSYPMLLVQISGDRVEFHGVVFAYELISQDIAGLASGISASTSPVEDFATAFKLAGMIVQQIASASVFPFPEYFSCNFPDGEHLFKDKRVIFVRRVEREVYQALIEDPESKTAVGDLDGFTNCVVKFCRVDVTPIYDRVRAAGVVTPTKLATVSNNSGAWVHAFEDLESAGYVCAARVARQLSSHSAAFIDAVRTNIVNKMKAAGLVVCDLRLHNIMVKQNASGTSFNVALIDLDIVGEQGSKWPEQAYNSTIAWPQPVLDRWVLKVQGAPVPLRQFSDDEHMLIHVVASDLAKAGAAIPSTNSGNSTGQKK